MGLVKEEHQVDSFDVVLGEAVLNVLFFFTRRKQSQEVVRESDLSEFK